MHNILLDLLITLPSILIALTVHEFSHAFIAYKLGDYTAKAEGRLTLNPLKHLDPIGTIMIIIFRFGWAKPVPISEYSFKNPTTGTMLVAFAGPLSNCILALIGTGIFHLLDSSNYLVNNFLIFFVFINIALMLFNLLPIPPLDGHKIIRGILPQALRYPWERLEDYAIFILIPTILFLTSTGILLIAIHFIVGNLIPEYSYFLRNLFR